MGASEKTGPEPGRKKRREPLSYDEVSNWESSLYDEAENWSRARSVFLKVPDAISSDVLSRALGPVWDESTRYGHSRRITLSEPADAFLRRIEAVLGGAARQTRVGRDAGPDSTHDSLSGLASLAEARRYVDSAWLPRAIAARRLAIHFQPIVELDEGKAFGYEALLRAREKAGATRGADQIFSAAQSLGVTANLDRLGRSLAIETAAVAYPPEMPLFLNVIAEEGPEEDSPERSAEEACERFGFPPGRVVLEIVETERIQDLESFREHVERGRRRGFRFALDDLSSGYSSLRYCHALRPDFVKIDRTMTLGISEDRARRAIVRMIVELSRELGFSVIAEGVENEADLGVCADLGISLAQGFFFARPAAVPPRLLDSASRWLAARSQIRR